LLGSNTKQEDISYFKLGLQWFGIILNFSPSRAFICNMMMKYNAHCASKQGEAKYCVFHCREYLGQGMEHLLKNNAFRPISVR